ncbi:MAG: hypothetical protein R3A10_12980 [Caldilineaceae bacterium]
MLIYRTADGRLAAGGSTKVRPWRPQFWIQRRSTRRPASRPRSCADPTNTGWIAAWSPPGSGKIVYAAIGPDGALRGTQQELAQNPSTGLAITRDNPRPLLKLDFEEPAAPPPLLIRPASATTPSVLRPAVPSRASSALSATGSTGVTR